MAAPGRSPSRVAIVGAGWAGLSAAVSLAARGIAVTIYEAGRHPGGRARRVDLDGHAVDNGQHLLIGAYRRTLSLMRRIGADPDALLLRLPMRVLVPGGFDLRLPRLPAPLHTAVGLFTACGAGWRETVAATRAMRQLQAAGYRLDGDRTVAEWLDAAGQNGAIRRYLWEPLCLAALNTSPASASAQVFANVLRDTLGGRRRDTDFLLPRCPLGDLLPEPAARWLTARGAEFRFSCRVRRLLAVDGGWQIDSDCGDTQTRAFDQVIVAVGPQHAPALLPETPALQAIRGMIEALCYEPIATVYQRYPGRHRLPLPIVQLGGPTAQWVVDRSALGPGDLQEDSLVAHVLSAHGPWEQLRDDELGARLHVELARAMPDLPRPVWQRIIREQRATFSCTPGLVRPPHRTPLRGLWLAGDYTHSDYPATLEAAVRSGEAVAEAIAGV
jgi:squalene-associated FAD-dependent desaturase